MFKQNISGSQPEVTDDMPDSSNPKCPLASTIIKVAAAEVDLIKPAKDSEENASVGDQG